MKYIYMKQFYSIEYVKIFQLTAWMTIMKSETQPYLLRVCQIFSQRRFADTHSLHRQQADIHNRNLA